MKEAREVVIQRLVFRYNYLIRCSTELCLVPVPICHSTFPVKNWYMKIEICIVTTPLQRLLQLLKIKTQTQLFIIILLAYIIMFLLKVYNVCLQ